MMSVGAENERARQQVVHRPPMRALRLSGRPYLDRPIGAHDIAMMMVLPKVACPTRGTFNLDDYVDVAPYVGLAAELADHV